MAVRTWVGRFGITQGQAQEMGPWQGVFTRQTPGDDPVHLYVLVHPALPQSEEFCGQMVAVIGHLFERESLSLTGALLKAIGAAHENLRTWNSRSLREHQVGAGLSCLAVRGTVAYLAQAGPSLAYWLGDGLFRRVTPQDPPATAVVGLGEEFRPEITRYDLAPGDLLLVTSPALGEIADEGTMQELLAGDSEQALSEVYLLTRDLPDFSAFLLHCYQEPEAAPVAPSPAEEAGAAAAADETDDLLAKAAGEDELELELEEEEDLGAAPPPRGPLAPPPPLPAAPGGRPPIRLRSSQPGLRRYAHSTAAARVQEAVPWWAIGLAAIVAVAVVLAWCVVGGSGGGGGNRFSSLLTEARQSYEAALVLENLSEKRAGFERAEALLEDAAEIRPDDSELQALRLEVARALAELDAVYEVSDLRLVADLSTQVTGDLSLQHLAVGGGTAYLLDHKEGRVIALPLGGAGALAEVILSEGDLVGAVKAAEPLLLTWAPDADGGQLLVLDSDRHLFAFRPEREAAPLSLRDAEEWESADGLAPQNGDLFVLDTAASQVWRYLPTEGGFDSERTGVLPATDLKGAVGFAMAADVYVLMEKGGVRRFSRGGEMRFGMDGIDQPLSSPSSLTPLDDQTLLAVDRGNKRVVAFTLDGRFQRQFVSPKFTDLQAVAVDGVAGRIYFLDGDSLYEAALPPPEGGAPTPTPEPPPTATPEPEVAPEEPTAEPPPEEEVAPPEPTAELPTPEEALPTAEAPSPEPIEPPPEEPATPETTG